MAESLAYNEKVNGSNPLSFRREKGNIRFCCSRTCREGEPIETNSEIEILHYHLSSGIGLNGFKNLCKDKRQDPETK